MAIELDTTLSNGTAESFTTITHYNIFFFQFIGEIIEMFDDLHTFTNQVRRLILTIETNDSLHKVILSDLSPITCLAETSINTNSRISEFKDMPTHACIER